MTNPVDGVIKFHCEWSESAAVAVPKELMTVRDVLFAKGWVGYDLHHQVGFGNVSSRVAGNSFIISGTQTGHLAPCTPAHFSLVNEYNIGQNRLSCKGASKASSESLTHAALYECSESIQYVLHIHTLTAWTRWKNIAPTTGETVPYGTPEMAAEIRRLWNQGQLQQQKFLVMAGHEGGLISFGRQAQEALHILTHFCG